MDQNGRAPPSVFRIRSSSNKIQLPKEVVANIGSKSNSITYNGAVVYWFYNPEKQRAVLSTKYADTNNEDLIKIDKSSISGVKNEDIFSETSIFDKNKFDKSKSGRITISSELPEEVYDGLVQADQIVLRIIYPESVEFASTVWVVLIPASLWDAQLLTLDKILL